jgi:hypothetical protein
MLLSKSVQHCGFGVRDLLLGAKAAKAQIVIVVELLVVVRRLELLLPVLD